MTQKNRYKNVLEMIREIPESASFADSLETKLQQRELIKQLIALRASRGMSQSDIAESMGCTQSRISKLESSSDGELRLADLAGFLKAVGSRPQLVIFPSQATLADQVKFHFFQTKALLERMLELAEDRTIAEGVGNFFADTAFNFVNMTIKQATKLPEDVQDKLPFLQIANVIETTPDDRKRQEPVKA